MCSPSNQSIIVQIIQNHIDNQECFTAYGVACEAATQGADEPNYLLRGEVHANWQTTISTQNYNRTAQFDIGQPAGKPNPWIYYPANAIQLVQDYAAQLLGAATAPNAGDGSTPPVIPSPNFQNNSGTATLTAPTTVKDTCIVCEITEAEHRLNISNTLVQQLGINGGDQVLVYCDLKAIVIVDTNSPYRSCVPQQLTANKDGRLRLSPKLLRMSQLEHTSKFKVFIDKTALYGHRIMVLPA